MDLGSKHRVVMVPRRHVYIVNLRYHLAALNVDVRTLRPFHYSSAANLLRMIALRSMGYNIIHLHWLYVFPFKWIMDVFVRMARILGYKIVWEVHNMVSHTRKMKDYAIAREFYRHCDAVIFHSVTDVTRSRDMLGEDLKPVHAVAYHPHFIGVYRNEITQHEARDILRIPPGRKVLLCFGQIRANRDYGCLLSAVASLDDVSVVIAGEIKDKRVYRELLKHRENSDMILHAGWVSNDQVQIYFNAADVVVLPYSEITTSGVIALAYSFSRPVIVSAIGGIGEVVNEKTGILVRPGDEDELRSAIKDIFEKDYVGMGMAAFQYARDQLMWERTAETIRGIYDKLL